MDEKDLVRTLLAEQNALLAYIRAIVRRTELADDVFQDVCLLAVSKRESLQNAQHLVRWLRVTARLRAKNVMRKHRSFQRTLDDETLDAMEGVWDAESLRTGHYDLESLRICVDQLPAHFKQLVEKRFVKQHEYVHIAAELNRPIASLYVTFSRIYTMLVKCMSSDRYANPGS